MKKLTVLLWLSACLLHAEPLPLLQHTPPLAEPFSITSPQGFRINPTKQSGGYQDDNFHRGYDLVPDVLFTNKKANVKVHSIYYGTVETVYPPPNGYFKGHPIFGGLVVIDHKDGTYSLYGHLKEVWVKEGQHVNINDPIGLVGNTGMSTGPHLHFEYIVDPINLLKERK